MKYLLGVDGGGTKSHLALYDETGKQHAFLRTGMLNHENMPGSYPQLKTTLHAVTQELCALANITVSQISSAVFGLAGVDSAQQHALISDFLREVGYQNFTLCNDGYLGIYCANPEGVGICAINGTGCGVTAIDETGRQLQIGGMGSFTQDLGGAGYLGTRAIGAAYDILVRQNSTSHLAQLVMDELNITEASQFMDAINRYLFSGEMRPTHFNRMLFRSQDDPASIAILEESAQHYAAGILAALRAGRYTGRVRVALIGSVFVKEQNSHLNRRLAQLLQEEPLDLLPQKVPPVAGAVLHAFVRAGLSVPRDTILQSMP